jgi:hypothetical protein
MAHKFELGQCVIVSRRPYVSVPFKGHREGRVTAVADNAVRVRWAGFALRRQKWVPTDNQKIRVERTTDV